MATKDLVSKVWIEEGGIVCDACETAAPTVFEVTDDTCVIRPEALNAEFTKPLTDSIAEAAEECPVDVIKFDTIAGEAPAAAAVADPAPAAEVAPAAAPASEVKAPSAPAPSAVAEPVAAAPAKAPGKPVKASVAGNPDPAIQALLRAATQRGGHATIDDARDGAPAAVRAWANVSGPDLPPDARQAKVMAASKNAKDDGATRRGILAGSALGIGWLTFGTASAVSGVAFTRFMMPNVLEAPDPKVRAERLDVYSSMNPGEVNEDHKKDGFWIIRDGSHIAALNIICTHLGCIPNWLPNDLKFKCPCHGSGFRPSGINFEGPAPRPLERFRISVIDGIVVVDRSKKFQYEKGQWDNAESFIEV